MGRTILVVDDEKATLNAFQRSLRGKDFVIFTAGDGQSALDILAHENIDIIISDMRMPNMNGHQLLKKVKEMYPATTRLILSGYAEETEITKAILDGSSKMYLLKPWDSQMLIRTICKLLEVRELLQNRNLLLIINKMDGLHSLPRIFNKVMNMIDQEVDMQRIAEVIEEDPVIAAKVLHIANSSFYGINTGSVGQAIVYLGLTAIKSIVLATSFCDLLEERAGMFGKDLLWNRASMMNRLVNRLYYKLMGRHISPTAATVGLLHDIGRVALLQQFPAEYTQMEAMLKERTDLLPDELEREIIGISHQEVGGYLLDWWGLPHQIVESAMFHHDPFNNNVVDRELVAVVHIANYYTQTMANAGIKGILDNRTFSLLGITQEECEEIIRE